MPIATSPITTFRRAIRRGAIRRGAIRRSCRPPSTRRVPTVLAFVALTSAVMSVVAGCGEGDASEADSGGSGTETAEGQLSGLQRDPQPVVADHHLPEVVDVVTGETAEFSFVAPAPDDLLLVFFGYTSCPDICPTTLADVKLALSRLGDDASRVSVAMATVDPERDTPEVLDGYVRFFVPERSHLLRTEDLDSLHEVEAVFGATSSHIPRPDGDGYDVEHSGTLYAVDADGKVVLEWPFGSVKGPEIAADLTALLEAV